MNKLEARRKMVAAFDDIVKGAVALIVTAVVTRIIDDSYDKVVVARRNSKVIEVPDA